MDIVTHPKNTPALKLYLKYGFKIESWKDNYYGDVLYDVWRGGGNADMVDRDHTDECYDNNIESSVCASKHYLKKHQGKPDYYDDDGNPVFI